MIGTARMRFKKREQEVSFQQFQASTSTVKYDILVFLYLLIAAGHVYKVLEHEACGKRGRSLDVEAHTGGTASIPLGGICLPKPLVVASFPCSGDFVMKLAYVTSRLPASIAYTIFEYQDWALAGAVLSCFLLLSFATLGRRFHNCARHRMAVLVFIRLFTDLTYFSTLLRTSTISSIHLNHTAYGPCFAAWKGFFLRVQFDVQLLVGAVECVVGVASIVSRYLRGADTGLNSIVAMGFQVIFGYIIPSVCIRCWEMESRRLYTLARRRKEGYEVNAVDVQPNPLTGMPMRSSANTSSHQRRLTQFPVISTMVRSAGLHAISSSSPASYPRNTTPFALATSILQQMVERKRDGLLLAKDYKSDSNIILISVKVSEHSGGFPETARNLTKKVERLMGEVALDHGGLLTRVSAACVEGCVHLLMTVAVHPAAEDDVKEYKQLLEAHLGREIGQIDTNSQVELQEVMAQAGNLAIDKVPVPCGVWPPVIVLPDRDDGSVSSASDPEGEDSGCEVALHFPQLDLVASDGTSLRVVAVQGSKVVTDQEFDDIQGVKDNLYRFLLPTADVTEGTLFLHCMLRRPHSEIGGEAPPAAEPVLASLPILAMPPAAAEECMELFRFMMEDAGRAVGIASDELAHLLTLDADVRGPIKTPGIMETYLQDFMPLAQGWGGIAALCFELSSVATPDVEQRGGQLQVMLEEQLTAMMTFLMAHNKKACLSALLDIVRSHNLAEGGEEDPSQLVLSGGCCAAAPSGVDKATAGDDEIMAVAPSSPHSSDGSSPLVSEGVKQEVPPRDHSNVGLFQDGVWRSLRLPFVGFAEPNLERGYRLYKSMFARKVDVLALCLLSFRGALACWKILRHASGPMHMPSAHNLNLALAHVVHALPYLPLVLGGSRYLGLREAFITGALLLSGFVKMGVAGSLFVNHKWPRYWLNKVPGMLVASRLLVLPGCMQVAMRTQLILDLLHLVPDTIILGQTWFGGLAALLGASALHFISLAVTCVIDLSIRRKYMAEHHLLQDIFESITDNEDKSPPGTSRPRGVGEDQPGNRRVQGRGRRMSGTSA